MTLCIDTTCVNFQTRMYFLYDCLPWWSTERGRAMWSNWWKMTNRSYLQIPCLQITNTLSSAHNLKRKYCQRTPPLSPSHNIQSLNPNNERVQKSMFKAPFAWNQIPPALLTSPHIIQKVNTTACNGLTLSFSDANLKGFPNVCSLEGPSSTSRNGLGIVFKNSW